MGFGEISTLLDVAKQLTLSLERAGNTAAASAALNASVSLKSAGAYKKRAAAAAADDRYDDAAVDLMRAMLRPGVDPQALEAIEAGLASTLRDLKEHREVEAKEEAARQAQEAREEAEREATEVRGLTKGTISCFYYCLRSRVPTHPTKLRSPPSAARGCRAAAAVGVEKNAHLIVW